MAELDLDKDLQDLEKDLSLEPAADAADAGSAEGGDELSLDKELAALGGGDKAEEAGEGGGLSLDDDLKSIMEGGGEGAAGAGESLGLDDDLSKLEGGLAAEEEPGAPAPAAAPAPAGARRAVPAVAGDAVNLDFLLDVKLDVTFEVGRARMLVSDLLTLGQGSVIELHRLVGEELDFLINGKLIAKGEVVVVNEKFGCRINQIVSPEERVKHMGGV
ncbi:MAG: flagellar motor switch protein FliN [Candidatus Lambdaproteobacteria bacterium]|nr:flagellar motor switch protein FliN [Candidatus Lambdaproteobacteria bacterium]